MADEKRRILDLLAQGKVTVEEAEQLLQAVGQPLLAAPADPGNKSEKPTPRFLRVTVFKNGAERPKQEVNIRVPISIIRAGMRLGAIIHKLAGDKMAAKLDGVDLTQLDPKQLEAVMDDMGEMIVDVDDGKAQVRVFCE